MFNGDLYQEPVKLPEPNLGPGVGGCQTAATIGGYARETAISDRDAAWDR